MFALFEDCSQFNFLKLYKSIGNDVDILENASQEFIMLALQLESTLDLKQRAKIAEDAIRANNSIAIIDYPTLYSYLANPKSCPSSIWRQLYLLERSIPPRYPNWTWFDRLKLFYNTYVDEHNVVGNKINNHKILFITHNGQSDHENLHCGHGDFSADFYYFDESLGGSTVNKMVKFDLKYHDGSLTDGIEYYKNHYNYNAKNILIHLAQGGYYFVDLTTKQAVQLAIPEPSQFRFPICKFK